MEVKDYYIIIMCKGSHQKGRVNYEVGCTFDKYVMNMTCYFAALGGA